jgi:hypothetical protein
MDKIYPPEKRRVLEKECTDRFLSEFEGRIGKEPENLDRLWNLLEECRMNKMVAVGVYVPNANNFIVELTKEHKPVIFICPERVYDWAGSLSMLKTASKETTEKNIAAIVVYHELAHAYMDVGININTEWEKTIEESFANAIAFNLLSKNYIRKAIITEAIFKQPLEYQGCTFWLNDIKDYKPFLRLWTKKDRINKKILDIMLSDIYYYNYHHYDFYMWDRKLRESNNCRIFWQGIALEIIRKVI